MKVSKNSSFFIREAFLDYFKSYDHTFIRSSPVFPICDPTLSFVNAGMNQFKNVFLGRRQPPSSRVVNSQKCIRVGGKHNDLLAVGNDGYHHTFFEMLGNWSFGDYFKEEACKMAWNFLTSPPISIPQNHLYVTYFGGDERIRLPPDKVTQEIWLSIGVDKNRILPFGMKDNFWEMGKTGPCGPCTEIHYDYSGGAPLKRAHLVNEGCADLIELWNIVFIQYNRGEDGVLEELPISHVDTGLGFERFLAVLQGRTSNYDTDLFTPLFETITKETCAPPYSGKFGSDDRNGLDTAYRILADHTRMCVIALADNMFPDQCHKLRRVLRKALVVAGNSFKAEYDFKLMQKISDSICNVLSPVYPEIAYNIKKVHYIIEQESELIKELKKNNAKEWRLIESNDSRLSKVFTGVEAVGLPAAYKEVVAATTVTASGINVLNDDLALKLYDTYGLEFDLIKDLADALDVKFSEEGFHHKLLELKKERMNNRNLFMKKSAVDDFVDKLLKEKINFTDDSRKYVYENCSTNVNEGYLFPVLEANIQSIFLLKNSITSNSETNVSRNKSKQFLNIGDEVAIVVDKTNFYSEAGGQSSDVGEIRIISRSDNTIINLVDVTQVENYCGYIFHFGKVSECSKSYEVDAKSLAAVLSVNEENRLNNMRNHTATHLINSALHKLLTVTCQKASFIGPDHLVFDFSVYKENFDKSTVIELEKVVKKFIHLRLPISRRIINSNDLPLFQNVTMLPGEVYSDDKISLVEITDKTNNFISREPCCGTHLFNTGDIGEFCILSLKSKGSNIKSIKAVTGVNAVAAVENSNFITEKLRQLDEKISSSSSNEAQMNISTINKCSSELNKFKNELSNLNKNNENKFFSFSIIQKAMETIDNYNKHLKTIARGMEKEFLELEMKEVLNDSKNRKYLIHFIESYTDSDPKLLYKATKMCPAGIPIMLISWNSNDKVLKARCTVPQEIADTLPAIKWMDSVCKAIGASGSVIRDQDPKLVYTMKPKRMTRTNLEDIIKAAVTEAKVVVETSLSLLKH